MANNLNSAGQYLCSTVGTRNTFIGLNAGNATTSQVACVAVGDNCLSSLTSTGNSNTAVGDYAGYYINTGTSNTCVGTASLQSLTSGGQNVCIGHAAANSITTGSGNTCVGYFAGQSFTGAESNNVMISNVGSSYVGSNGQIAIGTAGTHTNTNIAGIYGNTPGAGGTQNVVIDSAGNMGSAASSGPTPHNFLVYLSTTTGGVIGDNNNYKLPFDTVLYDTDSGYNLGTSTYTIPTTGIWMFGANVGFIGTGPGSWAGVSYVNMFFEGGFSLMPSGFIQCILDNIDAETAVNTSISPSYTASTMGTFAAGDTITLRVAAGGAASNLVAIQGNPGEFFTQFYGAQIG